MGIGTSSGTGSPTQDPEIPAGRRAIVTRTPEAVGPARDAFRGVPSQPGDRAVRSVFALRHALVTLGTPGAKELIDPSLVECLARFGHSLLEFSIQPLHG